MPWPAAHILIANEFLDGPNIRINRKEFIIGTSFPDIRYPAKLERGLTHFTQPTIQEILSEAAFKAGILFHSLVDGLWNTAFHHHAYFSAHIPHTPAMMHTLKILQDVFVYERLENWGEISGYFMDTLPEEDHYGVPQSMVRRWHRVMGSYLSKPPRFGDIDMLEMSLPSGMVEAIKSDYQAYHSDPALRRALIHLFEDVRKQIRHDVTDQSHPVNGIL